MVDTILDDWLGIDPFTPYDQADANVINAEAMLPYNFIGQNTPYGSVSYSKDPNTGFYTQNYAESPFMQFLRQGSEDQTANFMGLQQNAMGNLPTAPMNPDNYSSWGQAPTPGSTNFFYGGGGQTGGTSPTGQTGGTSPTGLQAPLGGGYTSTFQPGDTSSWGGGLGNDTGIDMSPEAQAARVGMRGDMYSGGSTNPTGFNDSMPTYTPEQIAGQQQAISQWGGSTQGGQSLQNLGGTAGQAVNAAGVQSPQDYGQAVFDYQKTLAQPYWDQQDARFNQDMRNRGIDPTGELGQRQSTIYGDQRSRDLQQMQNAALQQSLAAQGQFFGQGMDAANFANKTRLAQAGEDKMLRDQQFNELASLFGMQPINAIQPQAPGFFAPGSVGGGSSFGAAANQSNINQFDDAISGLFKGATTIYDLMSK